jgi:hypothetical protein
VGGPRTDAEARVFAERTVRTEHVVKAQPMVPKYMVPKYMVPKYVVPKYMVPKYVVPKYMVPKYTGT